MGVSRSHPLFYSLCTPVLTHACNITPSNAILTNTRAHSSYLSLTSIHIHYLRPFHVHILPLTLTSYTYSQSHTSRLVLSFPLPVPLIPILHSHFRILPYLTLIHNTLEYVHTLLLNTHLITPQMVNVKMHGKRGRWFHRSYKSGRPSRREELNWLLYKTNE